ncbi:signal peptidase I [Cytobacillus sp. IB215665]|uniref:signal peptidase I n=1 Tax=Cytobacillus sp. IB215665 TaxID=3097357 RepID=UPI002A139B5B|nr:signal peptidase I [Cytobacillus sp. IB215665]MDX8364578.1 signal peptidase I [Cytobacillus sp. IB215665]
MPQQEKNIKKEGIEWLKSIGIGIIIFAFFRTFFFTNYVVEGESMMPTLQDGNMLMVNKIGYRLGDLEHFDVVVFHSDSEDDYVKRVIGLPGDKIEYKQDVLYINDKPVQEPYLLPFKERLVEGKLTGDFTLQEITGEAIVPEDSVFVIGDNRRKSWDGRHFGFIKRDQVVGKVNLRYWPMDEFDITF